MVSQTLATDCPGMRAAFIILFSLIAIPIAADVAIPIELDSRFGSILIEIKINGRPATMLVDTGAASTFVRAELAGVDLGTLQRSRFRSDAGMEVSGVWERAKIELSGDWQTTVDVKAIDFTAVSQRYGRRIDGLLGQDVLRRFARVTIDFKAKQIVLSD